MTTDAITQTENKNYTIRILVGLALIIFFAFLVAELDAGISNWFKQRGVTKNPFEYPLVAVVLGLVVNLVLRTTKTYNYVAPAIKTELFLKIGLILMGSRIAFGQLLARGAGGLVQAVIMVSSVFFFTWWLAGKFNIDERLKAVMATAVSICGVSAAIAAAGSVLAKKEDITYTTALVIITALPLMVVMPLIATAIGLPPDVAGAWFGGNIDTTAAVVGAGTIHSEVAQQVAAVVKMSQNVFIGIAAFILAVYFVVKVERKPDEKPSAGIIWKRFPKFVLGFILISILASVGLLTPDKVGIIKVWYKWAFAMAFFSIGLELSFKDLGKMGWSPVLVFLTATLFNTLLALGISFLIFDVLGL
jgi:uncharacterized integral membrane protein (TIGR00698 family)